MVRSDVKVRRLAAFELSVLRPALFALAPGAAARPSWEEWDKCNPPARGFRKFAEVSATLVPTLLPFCAASMIYHEKGFNLSFADLLDPLTNAHGTTGLVVAWLTAGAAMFNACFVWMAIRKSEKLMSGAVEAIGKKRRELAG